MPQSLPTCHVHQQHGHSVRKGWLQVSNPSDWSTAHTQTITHCTILMMASITVTFTTEHTLAPSLCIDLLSCSAQQAGHSVLKHGVRRHARPAEQLSNTITDEKHLTIHGTAHTAHALVLPLHSCCNQHTSLQTFAEFAPLPGPPLCLQSTYTCCNTCPHRSTYRCAAFVKASPCVWGPHP